MTSRNGLGKTPGQIAAVQKFNNYIAFNLGATAVDKTNVDEVDKRIATFFEYCAHVDIPANVVALSLALGINKTTMYKWINGDTKGVALDVVNSIKKAVNIIESNTLSNAQNGGINPIAAALVLNNNFGYAKSDTVNININQRPQQTATEITERYKSLLPDHETSNNLDTIETVDYTESDTQFNTIQESSE